jgi:hypothetical protein
LNTQPQSTEGEGWISLAGVLVLIVGILNIIFGIAAISGSAFFTDEGRYVILTDLNAWGWVWAIIGGLQILAAFSIWSHHMYGRIIGVTMASISALVILFTVNAFPFAAFMMFLIDMMIIYALIVYGGRQDTRA